MPFKGKKTDEKLNSFKLYMGLAPIEVTAINPTLKELQKLYPSRFEDVTEEPNYVSYKEKEFEGKTYNIPTVRIEVHYKTHDGIGVPEVTGRFVIFLSKQKRKSERTGKYQVIDNYGNTAWLTKEEIDAKSKPMDKNGNLRPLADYKIAYVGQEQLYKFVAAYLNLDNPCDYIKDEKRWVLKSEDKLPFSDCSFSDMENWFKGSFKGLKEITTFNPGNWFYLAFGVQTAQDKEGNTRQYQDYYIDEPLKYNARPYDIERLGTRIKSSQAVGAYPRTQFEVGVLHEFKVTASDYSAAKPAEEPVAAPETKKEEDIDDDLPF